MGIAPSPQEDTPEDTATPEDVDYSEMSKSEIQKLIDDALDAGDIDMMDKLYKYL